MIAGGYAWEKGLQAEVHNSLDAEIIAGDLELDLQRIELELKLFRIIEERRPLTPDEQDRRDYLEALREIMLAEQLEQVA
jgi:hypothetical protein